LFGVASFPALLEPDDEDGDGEEAGGESLGVE
jgi:hypothetical protein